jgi:hypothetical protein
VIGGDVVVIDGKLILAELDAELSKLHEKAKKFLCAPLVCYKC